MYPRSPSTEPSCGCPPSSASISHETLYAGTELWLRTVNSTSNSQRELDGSRGSICRDLLLTLLGRRATTMGVSDARYAIAETRAYWRVLMAICLVATAASRVAQYKRQVTRNRKNVAAAFPSATHNVTVALRESLRVGVVGIVVTLVSGIGPRRSACAPSAPAVIVVEAALTVVGGIVHSVTIAKATLTIVGAKKANMREGSVASELPRRFPISILARWADIRRPVAVARNPFMSTPAATKSHDRNKLRAAIFVRCSRFRRHA